MKRLRRNFVLAATAMVITVATAELPSSAAGGVGAKANVSSAGTSRAAQSRTRAYWTPARMSHAKAMSMRITQAQAAALGASGAPSIGKPVTVEPTGGHGVQPAPLTSPVPAACCPGAAYAYPAPFTRYGVFPNSQYNVYPYRTNGKIFFTQGAGNFVCSGTVVSSAGHWLVETAGHCVANASTHTFSTNVLFVPAYRSGTAPFGTWSASKLWTSTDWINNGNLRNDRGFIILATLNGVKIQDRVGSEGILFNQSYLQGFTDFGYPQASPFNGATMQVCTSSTEETDPFIGGSGSIPLGIGCDQTGGSSGGGWIVRFSSAGGYVNGHNDYQYTSPARPREMFSPYFDNAELSLYNCATDNVC